MPKQLLMDADVWVKKGVRLLDSLESWGLGSIGDEAWDLLKKP